MRSARPIAGAQKLRTRRAVTHALVVLTLAALATITIRAQVADDDANAQPTIPRGALRVNISPTPSGRPIPAGFIGFSIEYRSLLAYTGSDPARPNPAFIALVRDLSPGGSPVIRFGGDTTDWTWWPTPGVPKPPGVTETLTPQWVTMARAVAQAMNGRLIFGINFEADSPAIARTEAQALLKGVGRPLIAGFELGNEPEVYPALGWYTSAAGVPVPGRPAGYGFRSYLRDYATVSSALPRDVPLVGPASGAPDWLAGLNSYLAANPRVRIVTFHRYPLHRCYTSRRSPTYPTIPHLLSRGASAGPATSVRAAVEVAHRRGLPFRVDELNNVSCGGAPGVSNTFASALWGLDTLFNMAKVGVDGVNIHAFNDAIYGPFQVTPGAGGPVVRVRPLYYGLLMFARAAPAGSRLLPTASRAPAFLRVWATRAPGGTTRIVLINDSRKRAITAAIRPPGAASAGTLERLLAPGLRAMAHITLAGQTFGPATTTGKLRGSARTATLHPIQGRYVVTLPPGSAALLTLGRR